MEIIKTILDYNNFQKSLNKKTIGFVPTMGYIHDGHLKLVKESLSNNDVTIVSIFVNPTQFGKNEDYHNYPRNIDKDIALLKEVGSTALFIPTVSEMYPNNQTTLLNINVETSFTNKLCGKYRPGHFEGVATIIMKLFSIIKADNAYFGLKDYQQFILIKNLAQSFFTTTKIIGIPTMRGENGLALSSRNSYLTEKEQLLASEIYKNLLIISEFIKINKQINSMSLKKKYNSLLKIASKALQLQYLEIYDAELNSINEYQINKTFIGTAVYLNNVRLIDNLLF